MLIIIFGNLYLKSMSYSAKMMLFRVYMRWLKIRSVTRKIYIANIFFPERIKDN